MASNAGIPRTSKTLAVFDPTTLPRAIPEAPLKVALIAMSNSGADVPKATMVKLIINAGIPNLWLKLTAPFTKPSPAKSKIISPIALRTQSIMPFYFFSHEHPDRPILKRLHFSHLSRGASFRCRTRKRPNIASMAIPTKNIKTIFDIISKPKFRKSYSFFYHKSYIIKNFST